LITSALPIGGRNETPPRTLLIREAEALGARTLDGLGMLVDQGVVSIRHWFGVDVEPAVMRRKVEDLFGV
jgi:shikimate dehydrogenase